MSRQKFTLIALLLVLVASFTVLLSIGSEIYREKPPIADVYSDSQGQVVFSGKDIEQGQLVWRSMGGHQLGSVWGHGAYVLRIGPQTGYTVRPKPGWIFAPRRHTTSFSIAWTRVLRPHWSKL